jgi:hypothetical protein
MKHRQEFTSTYLNNLNIVIEKNYTDDVFHIKLHDYTTTVNQIYFNKEDAKKIIKALKEMIKED